jgi:hypothetical protein
MQVLEFPCKITHCNFSFKASSSDHRKASALAINGSVVELLLVAATITELLLPADHGCVAINLYISLVQFIPFTFSSSFTILPLHPLHDPMLLENAFNPDQDIYQVHSTPLKHYLISFLPYKIQHHCSV